MTELVSCPRCGDTLDIPTDLLGTSVRCASCRTVFTPTPADSIPTASRAMRPVPPPREFAFEDPPPRKSNAWVWVLVLVLVGVFGGLVAVCTGLVRRVMNPAMVVQTSEEGRFRVAMPGTPTPTSRTADKTGVLSGLQSVRPENQETYLVMSAELPKDLRKLDPAKPEDAEKLQAELAKRFLPLPAAGSEVERETRSHGEYPAIDVMYHQGGGLMKQVTVARLLVAEGRVFLLAVDGMNLEPRVWYVRRFFTSFEPLAAE
jgi:hypothetical protein